MEVTTPTLGHNEIIIPKQETEVKEMTEERQTISKKVQETTRGSATNSPHGEIPVYASSFLYK